MPGIAVQDQTKIFREFVQLENPARERSKGLGLGLPIVERLCNLLRHPLSLRSASGAGATFAIEMPLVRGLPEPMAESAPFRGHTRHGKGSIRTKSAGGGG